MRRGFAAAFALLLLAGACRPSGSGDVPMLTEFYRTVDGQQLRAVRIGVAGPALPLRPAVLLLHGGDFTNGSPDEVFASARRFAAAGFLAYAIEYRLSDSLTTPLDALEDVCVALRWTRRHPGVDSSRVAIYGVGAGGQLAASTVTVGCPESAPDRGADALLLVSPALQVESNSQFTALLRDRATAADLSPVLRMNNAPPPTHIAHGAEDAVTPLTGSQMFCLRAVRLGATCDLRVYQGLGHRLAPPPARAGERPAPDAAAVTDAITAQVEFLRARWQPPE